MTELPRQSDRPDDTAIRITMPGGDSLVAWREGPDHVALVIDLGDRGGAMAKLPLAAAAYLAGGLSVYAGVHDG